RGDRRPLRRGLGAAWLGDAARARRNPARREGAPRRAGAAALPLPAARRHADCKTSRHRRPHRTNDKLGRLVGGRGELAYFLPPAANSAHPLHRVSSATGWMHAISFLSQRRGRRVESAEEPPCWLAPFIFRPTTASRSTNWRARSKSAASNRCSCASTR